MTQRHSGRSLLDTERYHRGEEAAVLPGQPASEALRNAVWGLGVRVLHFGKRTGLTGPFEHLMLGVANRLVRPPGEEVEASLPSGARLVVPPGFSRARTYVAGIYEEEVTALVQGILKAGMVVVDLGAFCGYYTLLASRLVGASGRVYAFEPDPTNYGYLVRNTEANGCQNVACFNRAVDDISGSKTLALHRDADHHWLSASSESKASIEVLTVRLDDFFAGEGWPSVDLIKMDIEGGETAALEGMRELSRRNPQVQLIMEHDLGHMRRAGTTPEALARLLQELGFRSGYIVERGMKPFSLAGGLPRSRATYNLLLRKE